MAVTQPQNNPKLGPVNIKIHTFLLLAALMVDKAMELKYIGGVFGGNIKPTPFLCLVLKMLQIQPEKDIIVEFLKNENFK